MNETQQNKTIWTIGHSTRTLDEFIAMLKSFKVELVVDIRSFPGSRRYPHFNKAALEISLPENNIKYINLKELGGRRKSRPDSINTGWRHAAFRGYADYMETDAFKEGIKELEKIALKKRTAYMCSEAVWWRCYQPVSRDKFEIGNKKNSTLLITYKKYNMQTKTIGIVLIVIGLIMIAYTGFNYVTTEKVVDLGPIQINKEKNHPVQWSPVIGGVILIAGIVLIVRDKKGSI